MESRKPFTRWTRPRPGRELPRACVAPWRGAGDASWAEELCPEGCIPGACCLAVGWDASDPAAWWHRRATDEESRALGACMAGNPTAADASVVADLAEECWCAGCPLENREAGERKGAMVPGCPGFCDAVPEAGGR